jgi:hypothetical protein
MHVQGLRHSFDHLVGDGKHAQKADILSCASHVRFTLESGHFGARSECQDRLVAVFLKMQSGAIKPVTKNQTEEIDDGTPKLAPIFVPPARPRGSAAPRVGPSQRTLTNLAFAIGSKESIGHRTQWSQASGCH